MTVKSSTLHFFGFGERVEILCRGLVEIDDAFSRRADGDFVHVGIWTMEKVSMLGHGDNGQSVGSAVGADRGPFQRIQRDIHFRSPGTDLFTDVEHRRLITLAFSDDDGSIDAEGVEGATHRIDCRLVRSRFVPVLQGGHSSAPLPQSREQLLRLSFGPR